MSFSECLFQSHAREGGKRGKRSEGRSEGRREIGEDLSVLVTGVDTRQAGQKYY